MEGLRLNRDTCQFQGFVDLGEYTPEDEKNEPGDDALVLMFQPFRGKWIQALACFLSKGRVCNKQGTDLLDTGLYHIFGERWIFLRCGNDRWLQFGITEENISCQHPCDPE